MITVVRDVVLVMFCVIWSAIGIGLVVALVMLATGDATVPPAITPQFDPSSGIGTPAPYGT